MKKDILNVVWTLIFMSIITVLSLIILSVLTYELKWQSDVIMQGITLTYIVTGFTGGILFGCLHQRPARKNAKNPGVKSIERKKMKVGMALMSGIILASLYWGIPGGAAMLFLEENISDMGRFALCWGMMAGSVASGILLVSSGPLAQQAGPQ